MTARTASTDVPAQDFYTELDSLRALAMIGVVAFHANILPFGWTGVWLFFVISGYVVTLSILRKLPAQRPWKVLGSFFTRRVGRIVPLYYTYIFVGAGVLVSAGEALDWRSLLSLLGFYHNEAIVFGFGEMDDWPVWHLWTIAVEMQFYMLFGAAAFFLPLRVVRRLLIAVVIAAPLARLFASIMLTGADPEFAARFNYYGTGFHFDAFAMGALLAIAQRTTEMQRMAVPLMILGALALGAYVIAYIGINAIALDRQGLDIVRDIIQGDIYGQGREVFVFSALAMAFTGLVAMTVSRNHLVQALTSLAPLQALGRVSYGAYVLHLVALSISNWLLIGRVEITGEDPFSMRLASFAITMAVTTAAAVFSYRYFEKSASQCLAGSRRESGSWCHS